MVFEYTKDQKLLMDDMFKRYGKNINGISRIVTRLSNLQNQYMKENDLLNSGFVLTLLNISK